MNLEYQRKVRTAKCMGSTIHLQTIIHISNLSEALDTYYFDILVRNIDDNLLLI